MREQDILMIQLIEELSEVQKEVSKALRFGLGDVNPNTRETNSDAICRELTDVIAILDELSQRCGILLTPNDKTSDNYIEKRHRISKYIDYSKARWVINERD